MVIEWIKNRLKYGYEIETCRGVVLSEDGSADYSRCKVKECNYEHKEVEEIVERLMGYLVCREKRIPDFDFSKINVNKEEFERHLVKCTENKSLLVFSADRFTFSPTAMLEYSDCPKKYELSQLLQMPERGEFEEGGAAFVGSFVHRVCEEGVNRGLQSYEGYVELAEELSKEPGYNFIDLDDVKRMLYVFFERNKNKIKSNSKTEVQLKAELEGFRFFGVADRIDYFDDGSVEIVDYKTNKRELSPKKRAWQLGYYALASKQAGFEPLKLTLDMLRLEKPVEMVVDNGEVKDALGSVRGFNLEDVKKDLVETAKSIAFDFEHEFKVTDDENDCRFCGYKFYCPKWDE